MILMDMVLRGDFLYCIHFGTLADPPIVVALFPASGGVVFTIVTRVVLMLYNPGILVPEQAIQTLN